MNKIRIVVVVAPITSIKIDGNACIKIVMKIPTLNDVSNIEHNAPRYLTFVTDFELDFIKFGV